MMKENCAQHSDRGPLFPGQSCFPLSPNEDDLSSPANLDQLNVIFSVIGTPEGPFEWVDKPEMREHLSALEPRPPMNFEEMLPGSPPRALVRCEHCARVRGGGLPPLW